LSIAAVKDGPVGYIGQKCPKIKERDFQAVVFFSAAFVALAMPQQNVKIQKT